MELRLHIPLARSGFIVALILLLCMLRFEGYGQTYCASSGGSGNNYIVNVVTTDGIENISNATSGTTYSNFTTTHEVSAVQGNDIHFNVKTLATGSNSYMKIWIDWNQDGVFDLPDEEAYALVTGGGTKEFIGTITVPLTASPGATRMRIATDWFNAVPSGSPAIGPCASTSWGEVEDYTFTIISAVDCDEVTFAVGELSDAEICSSTSFTVANIGTMMASGVERIWQQRVPSGTGTWTTIAGATGINYTNALGITEATDYRCIVTCSLSTESDTTNVATYTIKPVMECYCPGGFIPSVCTASTGNIFVADVYTQDAMIDLSNMGTECGLEVGSYSDYSGMSATVMENTTFQLKVRHGTHSSYGGHRLAWIDWNMDGVFSPSEKVLSSDWVSTSVVSTATITVPMGISEGATKMRVIATEGSPSDGPCSLAVTWIPKGEVEDYTINLVRMPDCDTMEIHAGVLTSSSICPSTSFTIVSESPTLAAGIQRLWQKKEVGTSDWTDIPSATSHNLFVGLGITTPTEYRCITWCTESGETDTSNIASYTLNSFEDCYCSGEFIPADCSATPWNIYIDNVSTEDAESDLSNLGSGCAIGSMGYSDYTALSASVEVNTTFTLKVKGGSGGGYGGVKMAWIDWNQDGVFSPAEKVIAAAWTSATTEAVADISVPFTAMPGTTRMRILITEGSESDGPCDYEYLWAMGEVEDYSINVIPMINCDSVDFPTTVAVSVSPNFLCDGEGVVNLKLLTELPDASAVTYQWMTSPTRTGTYTPIGTPTMFYPNKTIMATDSGYFYLKVLCNDLPILYSDTVHLGIVAPSSIVMTFDDGQQVCGNGSVSLTVDHSDGEVFWYENLNDLEPVYSGNPFETPVLAVDKTYFVTTGASPASQITVGLGTGTSSMYTHNPFSSYSGAKQLQYFYTAAELLEAGASGSSFFDKIGFELASVPYAALSNYRIKYKQVSSSPPLVWQMGGWTTILTSPIVNPTETGWYYFDLDSPLEWDGSSNIIFEICFDLTASTYYPPSDATIKYTSKSGRARTVYTYAYSTSCASAGSSTINDLPNIRFVKNACENDRTAITAYVRPIPDPISIGEDDTTCIYDFEEIILDAGEIPDGHVLTWDDGSHESTRGVNTSGTYFAIMNNEFGCIATDTVVKLIKYNPIVNLPADTTVCLGGIIELDAGDAGVDYYWNTSATTRKIIVEDEGMYTVVVTADNDCYTMDTTQVTIQGVIPTIDAILVTNEGSFSFNFKAINPQNVDGYLWDFGDGDTSSLPNPSHDYEHAGDYTVTLKLGTECGGEYIYETTTHIVSIDNQQLESNRIKLYPNPANDYLIIENGGTKVISGIQITAMDGRTMYVNDKTNNNKIQVNLHNYASGLYLIKLTIDNQTIFQKFELLK